MKPQDLLNYYKDTEHDVCGDQVLEELCNLEPIKTQEFIVTCLNKGISSPATTYKKLVILEKAGFITRPISKDDKRIHFLKATKQGRDRIKGWGKV